MNRAKNGLFACALAAGCAYSLFQKLQWPAVLSLTLLVLILYRSYTKALIDGLIGLITSARVAKVGQVEFQVDRKIMDVSSMTLKQLLLNELTPRDANLLLSVYQMKRWEPRGNGVLDRLRVLRDRGWLAYDRPTLGESSAVWLTPTGEAVARLISSEPNIGEEITAAPGLSE